MTGMQDDIVDLMHCLAFIYLRHGQPYRAVVLLIVAGQTAPDRADILRTLALALVESGMGQQALEVIARVAALDPAIASHPMLRLLRARALLLSGRTADAQSCFRDVSLPDPAHAHDKGLAA